MKLERYTAVRLGTAISIAGILLNLVALAGLLWQRLSFHTSAISVGFYVFIGVGIVGLLLLLAGLVIGRSGTDRQVDLDRDLLDALLEYIPDSVSFKDTEGRFTRVSRAMADASGLPGPQHAIHKTDSDLFTAELAAHLREAEQQVIRTGKPILAKEEKQIGPDGLEAWVLASTVPLKDGRGAFIGTMGITRNITDRKQAETRLHHMALHDCLTGLPNRALLEDRLTQAIALAHRNCQRIAVLMLGLNRFKNINDTFGHSVGDRILQEVAVRLKACLRESDTVARVGGDEFVIAAPGVASNAEIELIAKKMLAALAEPFLSEDRELRISGSIGICQFPDDGEDPATLLQCADATMYEAKKRGFGAWCFFSPALTQATRHRRKLENDLRRACERDEFVVHYQPFVSLDSGCITGVEALLRWRHPEQGLIPPNQFIPQLEELGLMAGVGRWVLKIACYQSVAWQQDGLPPIRMAVNVSTQQLYWANLAETVQETLLETRLDPRWLELELTESHTLDDSEVTLQIMKDLRLIGVSLSLDDFGIGWSSLSYLRRFPIDRIKIDQSFIQDVPTQPAAAEVVRTILNLGKNLGIACIAEGVETTKQRDYLKEQSCAEMQGFLFSKPLSAADCTALLRGTKQGIRKNTRASA